MARKKSAINRTIASNGYVLIWDPDNHLADIRGYVYEHRIVAEKKLGRRLKPGESIHHIDENRQNNNPDNIRIFKSRAYHFFEHRKPGSNLRLPDEQNNIINCACGCREQFKKFDQSRRPRKYISGHNLRIRNG